MYVTRLTCDFGDLDKGIVSSLTGLTRSDLENYSCFYFAVANLGWVSSGRIKEGLL